MNSKHNNETSDINPKSWLSKYRQNSIPYLIKMAFFYYAIGVALQIAGNYTAERTISGYVGPYVPYSLTIGLTSGPVEEIMFFGIPYYITGNPYLVLAAGTAWSVAHIFNTEVFQITNLAFGNFLFAVPHIFFSLRTWISGKGWFAIAFHSIWNITFLTSYCAITTNSCIAIGTGWYFIGDVISIVAAILLVVTANRLYRAKESKKKSL